MRQCPKVEVQCEDCKDAMKREDVPHHKSALCPYRIVECPHCRHPMAFKDLEKHERETCLEKEIRCKYAGHGCEWTGKRRDHDEHLANNVDVHLDLAIDEGNKLSESVMNLRQMLAAQAFRIQCLEVNNQNLTRRITRMVQSCPGKHIEDLCSSDEDENLTA